MADEMKNVVLGVFVEKWLYVDIEAAINQFVENSLRAVVVHMRFGLRLEQMEAECLTARMYVPWVL